MNLIDSLAYQELLEYPNLINRYYDCLAEWLTSKWSSVMGPNELMAPYIRRMERRMKSRSRNEAPVLHFNLSNRAASSSTWIRVLSSVRLFAVLGLKIFHNFSILRPVDNFQEGLNKFSMELNFSLMGPSSFDAPPWATIDRPIIKWTWKPPSSNSEDIARSNRSRR